MATKTISIMDDVYDRLVALKQSQESFSEELRRLTETKGSILDFAGMWKDMSEKEAKEMKKMIASMRQTARLKELVERFEK